MQHLVLILALLLTLSACGKSTKGKSFDAPLIKPPVDDATPDGLKSTSISSSLDELNLTGSIPMDVLQLSAQARIKKALTQSLAAINGGSCTGIVGCSLQAIDTRIDEVNQRTTEAEKQCQSSAPAIFDFHPFNESLKISVQCNDIFADNGINGTDSGIIFGKDEGVFAVGLSLQQGSQGKFGYAATYDQNSQLVNYLEASYFEDSTHLNRIILLKVKANKTTKNFEFAYAAVNDSTGLGCGTRVISNGSTLYISGRFPNATNSTCDTAVSSSICLDAKTLKDNAGNCSLNDGNFSLSEITEATIKNGLDDLKSKLGASHYQTYGTEFSKAAN